MTWCDIWTTTRKTNRWKICFFVCFLIRRIPRLFMSGKAARAHWHSVTDDLRPPVRLPFISITLSSALMRWKPPSPSARFSSTPPGPSAQEQCPSAPAQAISLSISPKTSNLRQHYSGQHLFKKRLTNTGFLNQRQAAEPFVISRCPAEPPAGKRLKGTAFRTAGGAGLSAR